jgi:hypothetical protein
MKRIAFLLIFLMGISLIQAAPTVVKKKTKALKFDSTFSVALGAGARNFLGDEEDVYGFANLLFFLDAGFRFNKNFEVFVHGEYLQAKGELTITKEETTLRIIPAEAGGRFLFGNHPFLGYLGAGLGVYFINEENPIGTVSKSGIGIFAEGGFRYFFVKNLFFDLKLKYVSLSIRPEDTSVNLGGISLLGGFGYVF